MDSVFVFCLLLSERSHVSTTALQLYFWKGNFQLAQMDCVYRNRNEDWHFSVIDLGTSSEHLCNQECPFSGKYKHFKHFLRKRADILNIFVGTWTDIVIILSKGRSQTYSEEENRRLGNFLMFSHGSVSESLENKSEVFIFNWSLKTRSLPLYETGENKSGVFIFSCSL